jgi:hypothetical protein
MKFKHLLLGILAAAGSLCGPMAQAIIILPGSGVLNTSRWEGNQTSQSQINSAIAPIIGSSIELYKQDVGQANDVGTLKDNYSTTFSNSNGNADIVYGGVGNIVGPTAYLLVKDGNHSPAWYLFNLTTLGWNGTETVQVQNFWPAGGEISHVTLYGISTKRPPDQNVPEGGATLALLGLGLAGLSFGRRFLKKA